MLKLTGVKAHYGYVEALKSIDIHVPKGHVVTILGANGAGKTSTLKCISGLLKISEGEIHFKGNLINDCAIEDIVKMGIVQSPEGRQVFTTLTVHENLMAGAYTVDDKLEITENLERVYRYFPRLKERSQQHAGTLSGGEQQMLAIGRALMASPDLLILDEPSLGLAPIIVKDIFEIIREIKSLGITILLVEQNVKLALSVSDYAYVLETGNIVLQGSADEILNNNDIKDAYLGGN